VGRDVAIKSQNMDSISKRGTRSVDLLDIAKR
jgi:hypothetical protein